MRGTAITAPLRWRFARLSGDLSYCLYLVHMTVGDLYQEAVRRLGIDFGSYGDVVVRSVVMVAVSFGLALVSRKYLEQPALRLKRYFEYGQKTPGDLPAAETAAIRRS
jgi:peptidoglycan/LPS O-acetylase OafA/YrhL